MANIIKHNNGIKTYIFEIKIEQDEDGRFAATCPILPGCATWGKTEEETLQNIREAVEVYIEDLVEAGEPIPEAREVIGVPAVSVMV